MYDTYKVVRKVKESELVFSLYLKRADGKPLMPFLPGQHLMFKFQIPGNDIALFRYYSFSDWGHPEFYRVSVKKEPAPAIGNYSMEGICSSYIFNHLNEGDLLEAKAPQGNFTLDPIQNTPVALFAGGIGITPLLCMLKSVSQQNPSRRIVLFYGVNNSKHHPFKEELLDIKIQYPAVEIHTFYNTADGQDIKGADYDHTGPIKLSLLQEDFKSKEADFYICGPQPMMQYVSKELSKFGIADKKIHIESFISAVPGEETMEPEIKNTDTFSVYYRKAGKTLEWDSRYKSLLEFSEAHDIEISSGCLFGDCGTCLTNLIAGEVKYMHPTMVQPMAGECLPCSCIPLTAITIDV